MSFTFLQFLLLSYVVLSFAFLNATESSVELILQNDRLYASVNKSTGAIGHLRLDDQDLLGTLNYVKPTPGGSTGSGNSGNGPYLDCYCTPPGSYTPGSIAPEYHLYRGKDSHGVSYGGVSMGESYPDSGLRLEQYWFLRDGETGLHTFSRILYHNKTTPFYRNLQEFRTLFRPNTPLWTHLSTNDRTYAPLPSANATANEITVQDATWYLANTTNDPYVQQMSDYFTKYTFADTWRNHPVHGLFADGSQSKDGSTFGAWLVMNTIDTYFGGPLHSDLMVDGIVYNYIVSNHHGDGTPNITDGFDRTFGPQYYHFNKGASGATLASLRADAAQYASPEWNTDFYDSIAQYVPNYKPTSQRGTFKLQVKLPSEARDAIAVLAQNGVDFQDNVFDTKAFQYWAEIPSSKTYGSRSRYSEVTIPRVAAGKYRLTIYAANVFGDFTEDDITVTAGRSTSVTAEWTPESHGTELFRIGTPDKSSGEYLHGYAPDLTHPLKPEQYRIYFDAYDFPTDFPDGVNFHVGKSKESKDFNYVHWSAYGGYAHFNRPNFTESPLISSWNIWFDAQNKQIRGAKKATFTVQLAGAKTAAGNTDVFNASEPWSNMPLNVAVNGQDLEPWIIPYYHSSSCGVRSAVICYNIAHKYTFPASYLKTSDNKIVLSLPEGGVDYESAVLPRQLYVQYDALRLEVK
ncbi:polysaccharide lyase family 4 protein [Rhizodiscina lignyota]|uniref:Polysaccharide lyase family 4 protein n=1 Tax=Rhizodiscina lignyota TaxID=1504668 RepID=A0A9P4I6Y3_9PEZI|nr:polysaccharide lyase family 4 protein [Rhizodiscina lignyota]